MLDLKLLLSVFLAFLVLVSPIQKILVITSLESQFNNAELKYISIKSNLTAMAILILFIFLGELIFSYIFRIEVYSFQIASGIVLIYNGFSGLQNGTLLKIDKGIRINDLSAVPIAIPMIAGPATITAAVTFPVQYGKLITILAIIAALSINLCVMLYAKKIAAVLTKFNFMNALTRIIGLIVATIGMQMVLNGVKVYIGTLSIAR